MSNNGDKEAEISCIKCNQSHVPCLAKDGSSNSNISSADESEDIEDDTDTTGDKILESRNATPSLAASSTSNILSWMANDPCHNGQVWMNMDSKELVSYPAYNEVQSGRQDNEQGTSEVRPTSVTLQVMDIKKRYPVQQRFNERAKRKSVRRKGALASLVKSCVSTGLKTRTGWSN